MSDRKALLRLTYGMYIVGAKQGDRINGQLCNTAFQMTSEPPMVSISINKQNVTHNMIASTGHFALSVLDVTAPFPLISLFGFRHGNAVDKFNGLSYRLAGNGAPVVLEHTTAYLEVKVASAVDLGTHTMFFGEIIDMGLLGGEEPMTYEYYHRVLKGLTPKTAPTYVGLRVEEQA